MATGSSEKKHTAKRSSNRFIPFFKERDGMGKLIPILQAKSPKKSEKETQKKNKPLSLYKKMLKINNDVNRSKFWSQWVLKKRYNPKNIREFQVADKNSKLDKLLKYTQSEKFKQEKNDKNETKIEKNDMILENEKQNESKIQKNKIISQTNKSNKNEKENESKIEKGYKIWDNYQNNKNANISVNGEEEGEKNSVKFSSKNLIAQKMKVTLYNPKIRYDDPGGIIFLFIF